MSQNVHIKGNKNADRALASSSSSSSISSLGEAVHIISKSHDKSKVYSALVAIRTKFIKQTDGATRLRKHGGIPALLRLLKHTHPKWLDVTLSIVGNCSTEEQTRTQILSSNGIKIIGNVLKNIPQESIQNRACRTLANLAQDKACCRVIHNNGIQDKGKKEPKRALFASPGDTATIIECIVGILERTENSDCQQTVIRAVRLLADTPEHKDVLLDCQAFKFVCKCLKSQDSDVVKSTLKTVGHFMQGISKETIVWQFVNGDGPASLINLTDHKLGDISDVASSLILSLVKQPLLRPCLGNAGAIDYFIRNATCEQKNVKERIPFTNALCLFCHEVINRVRIRDGKGLELFLRCLCSQDYFVIHYRIISSLVCFLYDDPSLEILIQNKIVSILIEQLLSCAHLTGFTITDILQSELHLDDNDIQDGCQADLNCEALKSEKLMASTDLSGDDLQCDIVISEGSNFVDVKSDDLKSLAATGDDITSAEHANQFLSCESKSDTVKSDSSKNTCIPENITLRIESSSHDPIEKTMKKDFDYDQTNQLLETSSANPSSEGKMKDFLKKSVSEPLLGKVENGDRNSGVKREVQSLEEKSEPRYSMDSPTYQGIPEWEEAEHLTGPRNIFEAQNSYTQQAAASPDYQYPYHSPAHSGPYSPLSPTSSYASQSPTWSLTSSPGRSTSPDSDSMYSNRSISPSLYSSASPPSSPPSGYSPSLEEWSPTINDNIRNFSFLSSITSSNTNEGTTCELKLQGSSSSRPLSPLSLTSFVPDSPPVGTESHWRGMWWGQGSAGQGKQGDVNNQPLYSDEEQDDSDINDAEKTLIESQMMQQHVQNIDKNQIGQPKVGTKEINADIENKDANLDVNECSSSSFKHLSQSSDHVTYTLPLHTDPVYAHTMLDTDFGKVLQGQNLARSASVESGEIKTIIKPSTSSDDINGPRGDLPQISAHSPTAGSFKRKRSDSIQSASSDTKNPSTVSSRKKRKIVPKATALLDKLLDQSSKKGTTFSIENKTKSQDNNMKGKDPETGNAGLLEKKDSNNSSTFNKKYQSIRKTTEHNILVILSRLSYMDENCTHLLCNNVLECLMLYAMCSRSPIPRAERMLLRIAKNPKCLEGLLQCLMPVKVDVLLTYLKDIKQKIKGSQEKAESKRTKIVVVKAAQYLTEGNVETSLHKSDKSLMVINQAQNHKSYDTEESSKCRSNLYRNVTDTLDIKSQSKERKKEIESHVSRRNNQSEDKKHLLTTFENSCEQSYITSIENEEKVPHSKSNITYSDNNSENIDDLNSLLIRKERVLNLNVENCLEVFSDFVCGVSMVVSSKYGRGVIQHMCVAAERESDQVNCALSLPVICRDECHLGQCMMKYGGLNVVLNLLKQNTNSVVVVGHMLLHASHCLHKLALNGDLILLYRGVGIHYKSPVFTSSDVSGTISAKKQGVEDVRVVFVLDDGEKVEANRSVVCTNSTVFSAMLEGHYSEKDQSTVNIPNANSTAFRVLLQLIQGSDTEFRLLVYKCESHHNASTHENPTQNRSQVKSQNSTTTKCDKQPKTDNINCNIIDLNEGENKTCVNDIEDEDAKGSYFETLLEVLELCDQFLLVDLQHDISNIIYSKLVNCHNVIHVFQFGMQRNCLLLSERCLSYVFLCKDCSPFQRMKWVKRLICEEETVPVMSMFKSLFERYMPTKMQICKA